jgi:preprotein translocase subunit SecE
VTQTTEQRPARRGPGRPAGGPPRRSATFYRPGAAERRKVIWSTRRELITYTVVSIFFVSVMIAIIAGFDVAFTKAVIAIFG